MSQPIDRGKVALLRLAISLYVDHAVAATVPRARAVNNFFTIRMAITLDTPQLSAVFELFAGAIDQIPDDRLAILTDIAEKVAQKELPRYPQ